MRGHADADRHRESQRQVGHRHAQEIALQFGGAQFGVGHQHHELLAAVACGQAAPGELRAQQHAQLGQHPVAGGVAVEVVDVLEVVDIHQRHGGLPRLAVGVLHRGLQRHRHRTAVGQAGEHVGAALFGQVGVLRQQHLVVFGQQLLVIVAFEHVGLDVQREAAQFHHQHHLPRQRGQRLGLLVVEPVRLRVEHAQRTQRHSVRSDQRRACVEAHLRVAGHDRVVVETHVPLRVFHHHHLGRMQDRMAAHRFGPRQFLRVGALDRLEPLPFGVDQGHRCHRGATHRLGDGDQVVERLFPLRIEDVVTVQRRQADRLVGGLLGLDHAVVASGSWAQLSPSPVTGKCRLTSPAAWAAGPSTRRRSGCATARA